MDRITVKAMLRPAALMRLSAENVGIPRTAMARDRDAIRLAVDAVGGTPVIIKLLQGTQGMGVMIDNWNVGQVYHADPFGVRISRNDA